MVQYSFPEKVVLVTGSSRGMGASILEAFARAGATCILNYFEDAEGRNHLEAQQTADRLRSFKVPLHVIEADIRKYESVKKLMGEISKRVNGLDILINNAGILRDRTIKKMSVEDWQSVVQTNLDGVFYCSKHGAEIMRDGGRVVNIASISGIAGFHGQANYAAAKAGVIALTKVMAKEVARRAITVNAVAPGMIRTQMLETIKPEVLADYERQIPVGRLGETQDVAHAVLFLACEESSYITGQTIPITGGWF